MIAPAVFFIAVVATSELWVRLWAAGRLQWRTRRLTVRWHTGERGQASIGLVVVALALIAAVAFLSATSKDVPDVLSQGLAGSLIGIGTAETTVRRKERAATRSKRKHPSAG